MKKTTINTILIFVIALMSVSICFLIFCIMTRPRYVIVQEPETAIITEASNLLDTSEVTNITSNINDTDISEEDIPVNGMQGKTSTRVNIRNAPSEEAKVIRTVDAGTTFDIIEVQDNGWTKIIYENTEAYISSNFVIITYE